MANAFFVPHNNQPVNTGRGDHGDTYTVPSGKFARVTITMMVTAYVNLQTEQSTNGIGSTADSSTETIVIYMDESEVLSFTTSSASASVNSSGNYSISDTGTVYARIGGSNIAGCIAAASACGNTGGNANNSSITGTSEAYFRYEEYNKIS